MLPFSYPESSRLRRHGPSGYTNYESYRPWLRDEFTFRCVYCLKREVWGWVTGEFDLDHFQPQARNPELQTEYDNLLYACSRCNMAKGERIVPDPTEALMRDQLRVLPDGSVEGFSANAKRVIWILDLNSPQARQWRLIWIRNVELAKEYEWDQYIRLMRFPDDLPDLTRLRPPDGNSRPEGIEQSHYARRKRGDLPDTY